MISAPFFSLDKVSAVSFLFNACPEIFATFPENEEYETLAGLILYYNEDIPEEGERISIEDISFEIVSVKSARIEEVRVKI